VRAFHELRGFYAEGGLLSTKEMGYSTLWDGQVFVLHCQPINAFPSKIETTLPAQTSQDWEIASARSPMIDNNYFAFVL
jgi:hypothetical protein